MLRLLVAVALCACASVPRAEPLVAAASDLQFALEEIVAEYRRESGRDVRVSYGSSGNFTRQIAQGAPYELFLSADEAYVEQLVARKLTRGTGARYSTGRLALYAPMGSPLGRPPGLDVLGERARAGVLGRFAIANPEHAPYGRAAAETLRHLGLWDAVRPRLVIGENAAQAARYASGGDAEGGLVALSLALGPELAARGTHTVIPESWHAPLHQRMVLLANASPEAEQFYRYVLGPESRAVLARRGFQLPAD
ncbi:MAG: molybdate ABC transporter substrate-binding protein [Lysobacterales bacterium]|nr:MAG: molybdate ABC transporter substrate-binding protein [Xanthomonadales bacterium]